MVDSSDDKNSKLVLLALVVIVLPQHAKVRRMIVSIFARIRFQLEAKRVLTASSALTNKSPSDAIISDLYIYPVKSLRAVSVKTATIDHRGFIGDRRFMVACPNPPTWHGGPAASTYHFITQRQCPMLATVVATFDDNNSSLTLTRGSDSVHVENLPSYKSPKFRARIWDDVVEVVDLGDKAALFLQVIAPDQHGIRLVALASERVTVDYYVPPEARTWTGGIPQISFTDEYPILVAWQASLDELNRRLMEKGKNTVAMSNFRPNVVIDNTEPFEEDNWKAIQIGNDTILHLVKGCPRCKQSCTDQQTGKVSDEPVVTLAEFRALGPNKAHVYFAKTAIPHRVGTTVTVGATVKVLKQGSPVWEE